MCTGRKIMGKKEKKRSKEKDDSIKPQRKINPHEPT